MALINKYKYQVLVLILVQFPVILNAQFNLDYFMDTGSTNPEKGLFLKSGLSASYCFSENRLSAGLQTNIAGDNDNFFSGLSLTYERNFVINNLVFKTGAFYKNINSSGILLENITGALVGLSLKHTDYNLGVSYRNYGFSSNATEAYNIDADDNYHTAIRIIYSLGGYIKPQSYPWNFGLTVTNNDRFLTTSTYLPMFRLNGNYHISENIDLFIEAWYKITGYSAISFNHYGYFLRTGITWTI